MAMQFMSMVMMMMKTRRMRTISLEMIVDSPFPSTPVMTLMIMMMMTMLMMTRMLILRRRMMTTIRGSLYLLHPLLPHAWLLLAQSNCMRGHTESPHYQRQSHYFAIVIISKSYKFIIIDASVPSPFPHGIHSWVKNGEAGTYKGLSAK